MTLTARQIELVQGSFLEVLDDHDPFHVGFYDALFRRAPHLRKLFRDDIEGQGMKFMAALRVVVDSLAHPDALETHYAGLGRTHAVLGVKPAHYEIMEEVLIESLAESLGDRFTAELEAAWRGAYRDLARRIVASAEAMPARA
jgi:nitric oxide dioxygenase